MRIKRIAWLSFAVCAVVAFGCANPEPTTIVNECELDPLDIDMEIAATGGEAACKAYACAIKKSRQRITVSVCAADENEAKTKAKRDRHTEPAAADLVDTACEPFDCPEENPCTTAGETCQERPAEASFKVRGDPDCNDLGADDDCAGENTLWRCFVRGDLKGKKYCDCAGAA